ncbi:MAG: AAA family ATPase [Proteobacteria bacterium]|nr:AAA family ATPase [Pseudomonadota bacterium]
MITKWKAFNFKSVRKETELSIAPLTIFAGANSSGKSTFLQSILLVAQTLSHKVSSRSVVLNGALARLGQFDDLRSVESGADQIVIGWTCQPIGYAPPPLRTRPAHPVSCARRSSCGPFWLLVAMANHDPRGRNEPATDHAAVPAR